MIGSPLRAFRAFRTKRCGISGLETSDTVLKTSSARSRTATTRTLLLPLITGALLGVTLAAHADDTPTTPQTPTTPAAAQTPAAPAAPAGPKPGDISYSGLIDIYYAINTRAPYTQTVTQADGGHYSIDNTGRSFDINDRDLSLSLGEFNITRTANKSFPLGVTATLTIGDTAKIVHANEPGGTSSWSAIQQLYLTYTPHLLGRDIAIDGGIFVTPFGYEVIESSSNDNYSRGFLFQYAVPLYHAGLRATIPVTSTLSLIAGAVNGWNNIADDNNAKSAFLQATWKPTSTVTAIIGGMAGPEGTGAYGPIVPKDQGSINTYLLDGQAIYQVTPKLKLAGQADYGRGAGAAGSTLSHASGSWVGFAGFARYQWTPKLATAIRLEQFEDMPGVGGIALRTGAGQYTKLNSFTLTMEYPVLHDKLLSRFEYRHDSANYYYFSAGTGNGGSAPDQDTFTVSGVYKF